MKIDQRIRQTKSSPQGFGCIAFPPPRSKFSEDFEQACWSHIHPEFDHKEAFDQQR
jgi:hypothetical protein